MAKIRVFTFTFKIEATLFLSFKIFFKKTFVGIGKMVIVIVVVENTSTLFHYSTHNVIKVAQGFADERNATQRCLIAILPPVTKKIPDLTWPG